MEDDPRQLHFSTAQKSRNHGKAPIHKPHPAIFHDEKQQTEINANAISISRLNLCSLSLKKLVILFIIWQFLGRVEHSGVVFKDFRFVNTRFCEEIFETDPQYAKTILAAS